ARRWLDVLEAAGARNVPWPMVRAAFNAFASYQGARSGLGALLVAPDAYGQAELTSLASLETAVVRGGSSLIVSRDPAPELCAQLRRWIGRLHTQFGGPVPVVTLVDA